MASPPPPSLCPSGNSTRSSPNLKSVAAPHPLPLLFLRGTHFLALKAPPNHSSALTTTSPTTLCAFFAPTANSPGVSCRRGVGPVYRRETAKPQPKTQPFERRRKNQFQRINYPNLSSDQLNNHNEGDPLRTSPQNVDLLGLCEEGNVEEALEFLGRGVSADYEVFRALLNLCRDLKSLEVGKRVHAFLKRSPYRGEVELGNGMIEMYAKCGSMQRMDGETMGCRV